MRWSPFGDDGFFVLVTFLAAAGFTLAWALFAGFGASPMTQALGLALLAGLPLYACGRLLRGINAVRMMAGLTGDGAFASLGAAAGVLVTGLGALSGRRSALVRVVPDCHPLGDRTSSGVGPEAHRRECRSG